MGNVHIARNRFSTKPRVSIAGLALANESMGFLNLRRGEIKEAARWFGKAVELDSESFLAHCHYATLRLD